MADADRHLAATGDPALDLVGCADKAETWLFSSAAPLWSSVGVHLDGMFAERIDRSGRATREQRRVRVQARQIYAFCELGRLGWAGDWRALVGRGATMLLDRGARPDGFFVHRFDGDGAVCDARADLYDSAFLLFAFAHAAAALGRSDVLDRAEALMRSIDRDWAHPDGGWREGEIVGPPRRQNPHMHMLEASAAMWRLTGDRRWQRRIEALLALGESRFIHAASGAITEYFQDDWSRADTPAGAIVEPGHCFEWAWLMETLAAEGIGTTGSADRLVTFARQFGLSANGAVAINEVSPQGQAIDGRSRLWPQAERLKAALARVRRTGAPGEIDEAVTAFRGLQRYLDIPFAGGWCDDSDARHHTLEPAVLASSFYHIVCALSELISTARTMGSTSASSAE